jgi:formylglycine-generating enzyme required for sulfatase activity
METVLVEGGTFNMGATPEQGDDAFENEKPVHQVTLNDFRMGIFEVTQKQWYDIMRDWNSEPPTAEYGAGDNYPMYNVSWNDIQQFIAALNAVYPDKHYRLPTEAEWEYAARGGNVSIRRSVFYKYSGSNDIDEVAWYSGNNVPDGNKPVGSKQPNELGIYDLCGNVYELCADRYGEYAPDPQIDPQGPDSGQLYVYRGGYWDANPNFCRVSYRYNIAPDFAYNCFGFRLVCD